jgi:hypothetical protein
VPLPCHPFLMLYSITANTRSDRISIRSISVCPICCSLFECTYMGYPVIYFFGSLLPAAESLTVHTSLHVACSTTVMIGRVNCCWPPSPAGLMSCIRTPGVVQRTQPAVHTLSTEKALPRAVTVFIFIRFMLDLNLGQDTSCPHRGS